MKRLTIHMGLLFVIISGCSTVRVDISGTEIRQEPAKVIKAGTTTREDILKIFGEPSKVLKTDSSEEIIYESRKEQTPTYLGGLVINEAGKDVTLKHLEIVIQNGLVQSYKFEARDE